MKKLLILPFLAIFLMSSECRSHSGDRHTINDNGDTTAIYQANQIEYYQTEITGSQNHNIDSIFTFVDTLDNHSWHFISNGFNIVSHTHNPDCKCLNDTFENEWNY